jgi:adenylate cyclase
MTTEGSGVDADAGPRVYRRLRLALSVGMSVANVVGAVVVLLLAVFIVPEPPIDHRGTTIWVNVLVAAAYVVAAVIVGNVTGFRLIARPGRWLLEGRDPDATELRLMLAGPLRLALSMAALWVVATVLFGVLDATRSVDLGIRVACVVAFGGLATVNVAYLVAERLLRPATTFALRRQRPDTRVQSVAGRQIVTWALTTGGPVLGLVAIAVADLAGAQNMGEHLPATMISLGGTALVVGLLATVVAARATADPIASVRHGVDKVTAGDLDVEVPVYDGTAIGLLQSGFNRMVAGLRERERLADLFGRHVGREVAEQAVERGIELGGEVRRVAVLFVDLVGSTSLAAERSPGEVVELLNRFFAVVVEVVEEQGGFINKFEGDAALAIFGAPADAPDRAARALRSARVMAERLRREIDAVDFGIGVAGGDAVAGNIGSRERLEYTVIGDPVNEAARLTDLAKGLACRVAASGPVVDASGGEAENWCDHGEEVLRGRSRPTSIRVPSH